VPPLAHREKALFLKTNELGPVALYVPARFIIVPTI
jgi:hypothetical protein